MMNTQTIKTGTEIEFPARGGMGGYPVVPAQRAKIGRWTKINGPIKNHVSPTNGGWHLIVYPDGGQLLAHETAFRIIDNRH